MRNSEKVVVSVSKHGQATIPERFREKLGISAPGRVTFREREDGSVVEPVSTPEEMRGFLKRHGEASTDTPATRLLREDRERDKRKREERFFSEDE